ncbi:MAG: hypothetical protein JO317_07185, partial [Verrucomicrobiae bacterium]|nr:hypothetical protein [Verrucomicrobiae bacterium]
LNVEGRQGEGPSLQSILRGAGEANSASVEYRQLYDQYAPEAEEAVFQERIPLGSKYTIKRYFEAIHPR